MKLSREELFKEVVSSFDGNAETFDYLLDQFEKHYGAMHEDELAQIYSKFFAIGLVGYRPTTGTSKGFV